MSQGWQGNQDTGCNCDATEMSGEDVFLREERGTGETAGHREGLGMCAQSVHGGQDPVLSVIIHLCTCPFTMCARDAEESQVCFCLQGTHSYTKTGAEERRLSRCLCKDDIQISEPAQSLEEKKGEEDRRAQQRDKSLTWTYRE